MRDEQPHLSTAEIAERWGCSSQHVRNLIAKGALPSRQFGAIFRVRLSDLEDYECASVCTAVSGRPSGPKPVKSAGVPSALPISRQPKRLTTASSANSLDKLLRSPKLSASIA